MANPPKCMSIYQDIFSNPSLVEHIILIIYTVTFLVGLAGNIMTIIIIQYNTHLRTPTNFYLLNLAVSDLMMLMCNLPLEMLEIYNGDWPLSIIFCKLRNISAEFFTCSSILTILAFTCERYFAIVHPVHLHQLSHFRRAQNIIIIIWLISFGFSLPLGLSYEIESTSSSRSLFIHNLTEESQTSSMDTSLSDTCKSCVPKRSVEKLLSVIIIITSICFFYLPMIIIGAIYLFIGQALRHVNRYELHTNPMEFSLSSQSSFSNRAAVEMQEQGAHINSYSWLKMRARYQARKVVVKTLVAVVSAFFVCYAPLYLQRLLVAIITLQSTSYLEFSNFLAYLYVLSGITFYLGSVINPILYNVVSNKYRRAFGDLVCCRLTARRTLKKQNNPPHMLPVYRSQKQQASYLARQQQQVLESNQCDHRTCCRNSSLNSTKQGTPGNITKKPMVIHSYSSQSNSSSTSPRQKHKHSNLYH